MIRRRFNLLWLLALFALCVQLGCTASAMDGTAYQSPQEPISPSHVNSNNHFALRLLQRLQTDISGGNVQFSPVSLHLALITATAGARGDTASQLSSALGLSQNTAAALASGAALLRTYRARTLQETLLFTNAARLWTPSTESLLPPFAELFKENSLQAPGLVDFKGDQAQARSTINEWMEEQTVGELQDAVPEGGLSSTTNLLLTDASLVQGFWATPFRKEETTTKDFFVSKERSVPVSMMRQAMKAGFLKEETLTLLNLPLAGNQLSMVLLLPAPGEMKALVEKLNLPQLETWLSNMNETKVEVSLPRARLDQRLSLKSALQNSGVTDAFSKVADFSGLNGKKNLSLHDAYHISRLDLREEGRPTKGTNVVVATKSKGGDENATFEANRPFLLFLRDNQSGALLFVAKVQDPSNRDNQPTTP